MYLKERVSDGRENITISSVSDSGYSMSEDKVSRASRVRDDDDTGNADLTDSNEVPKVHPSLKD